MTTMTAHLIANVSEPMAISVAEARRVLGRKHVLAIDSRNIKLRKGHKDGYLTGGLNLAPHNSAGFFTVCPHSTPECRNICVSGSGNALVFSKIRQYREELTALLFLYPNHFIRLLCDDLLVGKRLAEKRGMKFAARLNVFSDIEWENIAPCIFETATQNDIPLYDYTKIPNRSTPPVYRLILSHSEVNKLGLNPPEDATIAVPFAVGRGKPLPDTWMGRPVIDGDATDLRFLDPVGAVVGLRAKTARSSVDPAIVGRGDIKKGFVLPIIQ
jgi:hypothetical protein